MPPIKNFFVLFCLTLSILNKSRQKRPSVKIWSVINCTYTHTPQNNKPRVFVVYFLLTMPRVFINNCSIEELMTVPGIGAKVADNILELREAKGDLELDWNWMN